MYGLHKQTAPEGDRKRFTQRHQHTPPVLFAYGADKDKITSHNFSPDYGEEFEVFVPHVYVDHPKQILMPFVTK